MPATGERVDSSLKASSPTDNQWARAFIGIVRGLHAEIAQSSLTVLFPLVVSGLTSVIFVALGTVNLQFHGALVPIFFVANSHNCGSSCPGFPGWLRGKESVFNEGDAGSILESGRCSGEGHGNPVQCSCLGNPMDRGAWQATVHWVTESWT